MASTSSTRETTVDAVTCSGRLAAAQAEYARAERAWRAAQDRDPEACAAAQGRQLCAPGGSLTFSFPSDAAKDITSYNDARAILNGLEARARALHAARQRGGAR
jgi:hypothetical protein